jgi:hypothetical protein
VIGRRLGSVSALALTLLGAAACSSNEEPRNPVVVPPEPWTRETTCPRLAKRFCEAMKPCCDETLLTYDEQGCIERYERSACQPFVELARAGRVSFNLDLYSQEAADALIDHCIDVFAAHFDRCQNETAYDFLDLVAELGSGACELFSGGADLGAECTEAAECHKTYIPGTWVTCSGGKCAQNAPIDESHSCAWGGTACVEGLRCDAGYEANDGQCVPTTALGAHCEPDPRNGECGLAGTCDLATSTCKAASKGYGEPCESAGCRSGVCFAGRCVHPMRWLEGPQPLEVSLSPETCRGSELP